LTGYRKNGRREAEGEIERAGLVQDCTWGDNLGENTEGLPMSPLQQAPGLSDGVTSIDVLSPRAAQALHRVGQRRKWSNGKVLLLRGQVSPSAVVVLSGRLRVVTNSPQGEEHLMRWLLPGEITGLSSVIANSPFPADLIASGPTEVLHVQRDHLIELIQGDSDVALAIVRVLSLRVIQLIDIITEFTLVSLESKVLAALERLALYHGTPTEQGVELQVSQSDIAHAASASRQRVNLQLQRLQARGFVRLGYRRILLLRPGLKRPSR
jgi:CRP-like cAMP-binding protein